jgi:hypothetical protein
MVKTEPAYERAVTALVPLFVRATSRETLDPGSMVTSKNEPDWPTGAMPKGEEIAPIAAADPANVSRAPMATGTTTPKTRWSKPPCREKRFFSRGNRDDMGS